MTGTPDTLPADNEAPVTGTQRGEDLRSKVMKRVSSAKAGGVPQFKDNPIGALGFVFRNIAAGLEGRKLPSEEAAEQHLKRQALIMQQARFGIEALSTVRELTKGMSPEDAEAFASTVGERFSEAIPGFKDILLSSLKNPDIDDMIPVLGEHGEALAALAQGDPEKMTELAANSTLIESLDRAADVKNTPVVTAKLAQMKTIIQAAEQSGELPQEVVNLLPERDGKRVVTLSALQALSEEIDDPRLGFTRSELGTLRRNPEIAQQLGIEIPDVSVAAAKKRAEEAEKTPTLSPLARMQQERDQAVREGRFKDAAQLQAKIDKEGESGDKQFAPPELVRLQDARQQAREAGDTQRAEELDRLIAKQVDAGGTDRELLQMQDRRREKQEQLTKAQEAGNVEQTAILERELAEIDRRIDKLNTITGRTDQDVAATLADKGLNAQDVKKISDAADAFGSTTLEMVNLSSAINKARSSPGMTGARAALGEFVSGFVGQVDQNAAEKIVGWITNGLQPSELASSQVELRSVIAGSIKEITGEQSGRFTEAERALTEAVLQATKIGASQEQVVSALSQLMRMKVMLRDYQRIAAGREPQMKAETRDERKAALKTLIEGFGMEPEIAAQTLGDMVKLRDQLRPMFDERRGLMQRILGARPEKANGKP